MGYRRGQSSKKEKKGWFLIGFLLCCMEEVFLSFFLLCFSHSLVSSEERRGRVGGCSDIRSGFRRGQSMTWLLGVSPPLSLRGEGGRERRLRYRDKIGMGYYYSGSITEALGWVGECKVYIFLSFVCFSPFASPPWTGARRGYLAGHHPYLLHLEGWVGIGLGFFDGAGCAMHAKRERGFRSGMEGQTRAGRARPFAEGYLLLLVVLLLLLYRLASLCR